MSTWIHFCPSMAIIEVELKHMCVASKIAVRIESG
jgi:hypothetical protein